MALGTLAERSRCILFTMALIDTPRPSTRPKGIMGVTLLISPRRSGRAIPGKRLKAVPHMFSHDV